MTATPYLILENCSGEPLSPLDPDKRHYPESWLQELLRQHPGILPVKEIETVFDPLVPIGREVPVSSGFIDNLFISPQGYPVLVETKLWRNPEAKREVMIQIIEYAASMITKWTFSDLDQVTRKYTAQYEGSSFGLVDWIRHYTHGSEKIDPIFFEETVSKNLRLGRFLMLLVGDRIRSSLVDILEFTNRYPHLALNVALVELQCFQIGKGVDWPLLVHPSIIARTHIVERSVVQVTVEQNGAYAIKVKQEKDEEPGKGGRQFLTEEAFWELLKKNRPANYEKAQDLVDRYRDQEGVVVDHMKGSLVIRLKLPDTNEQLSLFSIDKKGNLTVLTGNIEGQLKRAGYDPSLRETYRGKVKQLLHSQDRYLPSSSILNVDLTGFMIAVNEFIEIVQNANRVE
jgi:hypothetical protein